MHANLCRVVLCALALMRADSAGFQQVAAPTPATTWQAEYQRPPIPFPEDNPYSAAKADLGRMLFFEPLLSRAGDSTCARCHNPSLSWGDGLPRAFGKNGATALRTPTLLNNAWTVLYGWTGRYPDLEAVTFGAITGHADMDLPEAEALRRLSANPGYIHAFAAAFGDGGITRRTVELAITTFERTIVAGEAPFDRWIEGDEGAIDAAAKRGFALFNGRARCAECHSGWAFTDGSFADIGSAEGDDIGRGRLVPEARSLRYAFKVPTLRDVARRAPYMHDGSIPTLAAVIDLYDRGGIERPGRSPLVRPLGLTAMEKAGLIAFLQTLTGAAQPTYIPILPR